MQFSTATILLAVNEDAKMQDVSGMEITGRQPVACAREQRMRNHGACHSERSFHVLVDIEGMVRTHTTLYSICK